LSWWGNRLIEELAIVACTLLKGVNDYFSYGIFSLDIKMPEDVSLGY
jgi:hypothetical protein